MSQPSFKEVTRALGRLTLFVFAAILTFIAARYLLGV